MKPLQSLLDSIQKTNDTYGVTLWQGPKTEHTITIIPPEGPQYTEMFTEIFETVSFAHARAMALQKYGPGFRVLFQQEDGEKL